MTDLSVAAADEKLAAAVLELAARAEAEGLPLNALVARIDAERVEARHPANLASAIRAAME